MDGVQKQTVIDLYTLASAQAGLSAESSMGQLLRFEAAAAEAAADLTAALRARRVSKSMIEHLNTLADLASVIGARELESVCLESLKIRGETKDIAALMGQNLLFSETLERTRVAASVVFDLCEAMGLAPNGKPLPPDALDEAAGLTAAEEPAEEKPLFEAL